MRGGIVYLPTPWSWPEVCISNLSYICLILRNTQIPKQSWGELLLCYTTDILASGTRIWGASCREVTNASRTPGAQHPTGRWGTARNKVSDSFVQIHHIQGIVPLPFISLEVITCRTLLITLVLWSAMVSDFPQPSESFFSLFYHPRGKGGHAHWFVLGSLIILSSSLWPTKGMLSIYSKSSPGFYLFFLRMAEFQWCQGDFKFSIPSLIVTCWH